MPAPALRPAPAALALLLCALPLAPTRSTAQETPGDTVRRARLDTLTVRVLRTPLPLLRAPYAVSAVGEAEIRRARPGLALDEALAGVPGVQVDNRFNYALGERISIRGSGARAQFGVRGIRVLVDGIPATMPDGQTTLNHVDPGALGRAEVVRGPAAALYGNASGGVVHLATAPPPPVPLGSEYRVVTGGGGLLRLQGSAGGETGRFSYRAGATRLRYEGFREHSEADNTLLNAQLRHGGERNGVRLALSLVEYNALNPGSLSDSLLRADRRRAFARNVAQRTGEEGRQGQVGVTWERALGPAALETSAYALARRLENPIPDRIIDLDRRVGGARAMLSGRAGAGVRWTMGGEVEGQRDRRENHRNDGGERRELLLDQRERVTSTAVFAQASASPASRVELLGAVRWDRFRFAVRDRLVTAANPDDSGERIMAEWSPTLGASFAASEALVVYANFATAFETPTTTELANRPSGAGGFNPELEPQRTRSWEAGAKGRLGRWGVYDVAAYRARARNELIPFEVPGVPGRQFFRNAGSTTRRGVEAGATLTPMRGVTARLAYTHIDARFRRYVVGRDTLDGKRVPGIAPHRVDARLAWQGVAGPFAEAELRHSAAIPVDDPNRFRSPAYTVADARAGWEGARLGRLRATPFLGVTNLFDREYNTSVVVNAFGRRFYEPGPGRTLYAGLSVGVGLPEGWGPR
ncbi:MAG TPA: TonB-dependent receptor [Longimicrobiaceae bacterium]|nr:TonB-dependent receptor [Longimicrobiaceae bacterium]